MNVQAPVIRTAEDFLRTYEGIEGKREFVRGRVVDMMVNVSRNHMRLTMALSRALASRLDLDAFDVSAADFGVMTPDGVRFPDVMVDKAGGRGKALSTSEPLLIAEVLSPSSLASDFGEKMRDYTGIASLLHYLVLSQDEPRIWLWKRGEDGAFEAPEMIVGAEESVLLDGLGLTIPLGELYRGVA